MVLFDYHAYAEDESEIMDEDLAFALREINSTKFTQPIVVNITLGLWDGARKLKPLVVVGDNEYNSIHKAVMLFSANADGITIIYDDDNKNVLLQGFHHDGTNTCTIERLGHDKDYRDGERLEEGEYTTLPLESRDVFNYLAR